LEEKAGRKNGDRFVQQLASKFKLARASRRSSVTAELLHSARAAAESRPAGYMFCFCFLFILTVLNRASTPLSARKQLSTLITPPHSP